MNSISKKYLAPFILAVALIVGVIVGLRPVAQSIGAVSNPRPTNSMAQYYDATVSALIAGTAATNLTDLERNQLMNESIKTNLAAQLWFRTAMNGNVSSLGRRISEEIGLLEHLRAGRTKDAIRQLDETLDTDIAMLTQLLDVADGTKTFTPTRYPREELKEAKEYRLKFPSRDGVK